MPRDAPVISTRLPRSSMVGVYARTLSSGVVEVGATGNLAVLNALRQSTTPHSACSWRETSVAQE